MKKKTLIVVMMFLTGCSGMSTMNQDFVMAGSPEGIRAYNDGIIGTAKTAKESPDADSKYFAHRGQEEAENTARVKQVSFWGKLAGGNK